MLPDFSAAKGTGFMLRVVPARAAQVVCGAGLGAKSAPLLGLPGVGAQAAEPQAAFC